MRFNVLGSIENQSALYNWIQNLNMCWTIGTKRNSTGFECTLGSIYPQLGEGDEETGFINGCSDAYIIEYDLNLGYFDWSFAIRYALRDSILLW